MKEEVPKKALATPAYLKFDTIDYNVKERLEEIQVYLMENYVGDKAGKSRFNYSYDFLNWWLTS